MDLKSLLTNPYMVSLLFSSIVTSILYYSRDKSTKASKPMSFYIFIFIVSCVIVYCAFYMLRRMGSGGISSLAAVTSVAGASVLRRPNGSGGNTPSTPSTPKASILSEAVSGVKNMLGGSNNEPIELPTEPIMVGML
jgi:hypothetical protein